MSLTVLMDSLPENLQHNVRLKAVLMELTEDRYNHTDERKMLILSISRLWAVQVAYLDSGFSEYICSHVLNYIAEKHTMYSGYYHDFSIDPLLQALYDHSPYHFLFAMEYPLERLHKMLQLLEDYIPGKSTVCFMHSEDEDYHNHVQNYNSRDWVYAVSNRTIPVYTTYTAYMRWRRRMWMRRPLTPWRVSRLPGPVYDINELYHVCLSPDQEI
jgi:hypothetical protein